MTETFDFGIVEYDFVESLDGKAIEIVAVNNNNGEGNNICGGKMQPDKVVFPSEINGLKVVSVKKQAFSPFTCNELFLPYGLTLSPRTFWSSGVAKVHIPGVKIIPESCFQGSSLEELMDFGSVECVESAGFAFTSNLKAFKWFPNCCEIPTKCFAFSGIELISNINNVPMIGIDAFRGSCIKEISLPDQCWIGGGCFAYTPISKISVDGDIFLHTDMFTGCSNRIKLTGCNNVTLQMDNHPSHKDDIFDIGFDSILVKVND